MMTVFNSIAVIAMAGATLGQLYVDPPLSPGRELNWAADDTWAHDVGVPCAGEFVALPTSAFPYVVTVSDDQADAHVITFGYETYIQFDHLPGGDTEHTGVTFSDDFDMDCMDLKVNTIRILPPTDSETNTLPWEDVSSWYRDDVPCAGEFALFPMGEFEYSVIVSEESVEPHVHVIEFDLNTYVSFAPPSTDVDVDVGIYFNSEFDVDCLAAREAYDDIFTIAPGEGISSIPWDGGDTWNLGNQPCAGDEADIVSAATHDYAVVVSDTTNPEPHLAIIKYGVDTYTSFKPSDDLEYVGIYFTVTIDGECLDNRRFGHGTDGPPTTTTPGFETTTTDVVDTPTTPSFDTATPVVDTTTPVVDTATTPVFDTATTPVFVTGTPVVDTATTPVFDTATTPVFDTATTPAFDTGTPVVDTTSPVDTATTPVQDITTLQQCSNNCGSPAKGGGQCKPGLPDQCTVCNTDKLLMKGFLPDKTKFASCVTKFACEVNKITSASISKYVGGTCTCDDRKCHKCTRLPTGDVCKKCKGETYLHEGGCNATCPDTKASSGNRDVGRKCLDEFTCKKGAALGVGGTCKCVTSENKFEPNCVQCAFEAGGIGEKCIKCINSKVLDDVGRCVENCSGVPNSVTYAPKAAGSQCRDPFTCDNGVDSSGAKCLCKSSDIPGWRDCASCDWSLVGESCNVCKNNKYLHDGDCVKKCPEGTVGRKEGRVGGECVPE